MGIFALACLIIGIIGAGTVATVYVASDKYRQEMIDGNGYFDEKMKIGEFFTVSYFSNNETVETAMDLDYVVSANNGQIKKGRDQIGSFLSYNNPSGLIRIYLPKDEWFRNEFNGTIKSFWDRESHYTENKNCFQLCFVLMDPTEAIASFQIDPQSGKLEYKLPSDSPTRGWEVLKVYKQTGYFSRQGNVLQKKVEVKESLLPKEQSNLFKEQVGMGIPMGGYDKYGGEAMERKYKEEAKQEALAEIQEKIKEAQEGGGSGLSEYLYSNYGEEYAKNEFDVWYDSFHGQAIAIGTQILIGIGTGGLATAVVESMAGSYALSVAVRSSIIIGSEIIVGVPEAVYLYNRGYTSIAAIIVICCFIPLVTEFKLGRIILNLPPSDEKLIRLIINNAVDPETGKLLWTTPKQFKSFIKGLSEAEQKILAEQLSAVAAYYEKNGVKELIQQTNKGLRESLVKMSKIPRFKSPVQMYESLVQFGIITRQLSSTIILAEKELGSKLAFTNYPVLKTFGFTIFGLMGPLMIASVLLIGNNEKLIKDPQNLLDGSEKAIKYFTKEMKNLSLQLQTFVQQNNNEINLLCQNPTKENLKKALDLSYTNYIVLKNLTLFTQTGWSDLFLAAQGNQQERTAFKILSNLQITYLNSLINKNIDAQNEGNTKAAQDYYKEMEKTAGSTKIKSIADLNKKGRSEDCKSCSDISKSKISMACSKENKVVNYTKDDVDSFLTWIIGINVSACTQSTVGNYGNFSKLGQNFETSRNVYTLSKSGQYEKTVKISTFYPSKSIQLQSNLIYFCKESDKTSLESEFYNLNITRSLFTQFFDDWLKSEKDICSSSVGNLIKKDETIPNKNSNTTEKGSDINLIKKDVTIPNKNLNTTNNSSVNVA